MFQPRDRPRLTVSGSEREERMGELLELLLLFVCARSAHFKHS